MATHKKTSQECECSDHPGSRESSKGEHHSSKSAHHGQVEGAAQATTSHDQIRRWVEERHGKPACVRGTGDKNDIGMLRIDMPGYTGEDKLEHISWDEWFGKFEEKRLAFLHQDKMADGKRSNFNKLVSRD